MGMIMYNWSIIITVLGVKRVAQGVRMAEFRYMWVKRALKPPKLLSYNNCTVRYRSFISIGVLYDSKIFRIIHKRFGSLLQSSLWLNGIASCTTSYLLILMDVAYYVDSKFMKQSMVTAKPCSKLCTFTEKYSLRYLFSFTAFNKVFYYQNALE